MLRAKNLFDDSYRRILGLHELYNYLTRQNYNADFVSDILRSEIVNIVSAFDKLMHDLIKEGILETFNNLRSATPSYHKFPINIFQMQAIISPTPTSDPNEILGNIIIDNHKHLSFQDPDKITQALSLIWNETHKWQKVAKSLSIDESSLKVELRNIIIRRNQIVHEADIDLFTGNIQPINSIDVSNSVNFIYKLGIAIYNLVKLP
ncbi:hypothetical protein HZP84_12360 [Elizabethkingia anophelis]|nr:hypothetical protein [Elizabethkingia anophelis]MCT3824069.1 hypothetical protein [Elizabethkingia anophelis]MCT3931386.1 hypothetical protein [Elizabethkingia anophelis]MCT4077243.1 hypothetical protein [Elizabethkingia anophelis]MCT4080924.1 hypothetical protein [Elizabethkingia anophelis]